MTEIFRRLVSFLAFRKQEFNKYETKAEWNVGVT